MQKQKRWQRSNRKKIVLGVTGVLASGKTTVARMLGPYVIDADKIAHRVIRRGTGAYKKIIKTFSRDILKKDRNIDRNKLAKIVFSDKNLLKRLNKITHPEIIRVIKHKVRVSPKNVVVLDAPLLLEAGLGNFVDKIIVVKITKREQLRRLLRKTGLQKEAILKRIKAQMPQEIKVRMADFLIDNSGTKKFTKKQVKVIRRLLWRS